MQPQHWQDDADDANDIAGREICAICSCWLLSSPCLCCCYCATHTLTAKTATADARDTYSLTPAPPNQSPNQRRTPGIKQSQQRWERNLHASKLSQPPMARSGNTPNLHNADTTHNSTSPGQQVYTVMVLLWPCPPVMASAHCASTCVYAAHTSTKPSDQVGAFSCYLTKLLPSVVIVLNFTCYHTHYTHCYKSDKVRRATKRVSELEKGFRGALPVTVRWEENQRLLRMGRLGHLVLANSGRLESHTAKNVRSNSVCCCNCCNHRVIIIIHRHNIASCWNIYTDILLLQWCKLM